MHDERVKEESVGGVLCPLSVVLAHGGQYLLTVGLVQLLWPLKALHGRQTAQQLTRLKSKAEWVTTCSLGSQWSYNTESGLSHRKVPTFR